MSKSNGKRKTRLVTALQAKLKEYAQAGREGDVRAVQTELAYVMRVGALNRAEDDRIRARFNLELPLCTMAEKLVNAEIPVRVAPIISSVKSPGPIPVLPDHQAPISRPKAWERLRWGYVHFCVHCDEELQRAPEGRWSCVNPVCSGGREVVGERSGSSAALSTTSRAS